MVPDHPQPAAVSPSLLTSPFLLPRPLLPPCTLLPLPACLLQEIIELSCVVVDTSSLQLLGPAFQRYVRPDQHPQLTEFCTELTGITQAMWVLRRTGVLPAGC